MQYFLPLALAKSVNALMFSINNKLRTLLLASGLMIVFSMQAHAQDDWTALTTIDGVEISYQKSKCDDLEVLLIKAVNTTANKFSLSLNYTFTMDGNEVGAGSLGELSLEANESLFSSCSDGLKINVYDHVSMFDEDMFSLKISKSE